MPIIDQAASVANMARMWVQGLDRTSLNTTIPTATLELMLTTLIELAERPQTMQYRDKQHREVLGTLTQLEAGIRIAREEAERG